MASPGAEPQTGMLPPIEPELPSGVNPDLTPKRATVETMEYAAMMRRVTRAYGRRVADADVEDLAELIELRDVLDEAIGHAVEQSRARWGRSWADIARAAGITRQAAQQRWGRNG